MPRPRSGHKQQPKEDRFALLEHCLQFPLHPRVEVALEDDPDSLYKRGHLLHSVPNRDAITVCKYDGDLMYFATRSGKIHSWHMEDGLKPKPIDTAQIQFESRLSGIAADAELGDDVGDDDDEEEENSGDEAAKALELEQKEKERQHMMSMEITCFEQSGLTTAVGFDTGAIGLYTAQGKAWYPHGKGNKPGDVPTSFIHADRVSALSFVESSIFSAGHDGNFLIRRVNEDRVAECYHNCACPLSDMVVEEPHLVMLSSWDGTVKYLDLRMKSLVREFRPNGTTPVRCLAYAPDSLYCSYGSGNIMSFDLRTGRVLIPAFEGHCDVVNSMSVHKNRLFTASDDKTVRIFDTMKGTCLDALSGHDDDVSCLCLVDKTLVTGSFDGTLRAYETAVVEDKADQRKRRLDQGVRLSQELYQRHREEHRTHGKKASKRHKSPKKK